MIIEKVKRYDLHHRPDWAYNQASMMPAKEGRYVLYSDAQSVEADRQRYEYALNKVIVACMMTSDTNAIADMARAALKRAEGDV